jgi:hypothetical protein
MAFGVFCIAGVIHAFLGFYETQGKTLEEIEGVFNSGLPAWKSASIESHFEEKVHGIEDKQAGRTESVGAATGGEKPEGEHVTETTSKV